ncbi:unnamed protein product, partial [Mesorhabditis spiculigera]
MRVHLLCYGRIRGFSNGVALQSVSITRVEDAPMCKNTKKEGNGKIFRPCGYCYRGPGGVVYRTKFGRACCGGCRAIYGEPKVKPCLESPNCGRFQSERLKPMQMSDRTVINGACQKCIKDNLYDYKQLYESGHRDG